MFFNVFKILIIILYSHYAIQKLINNILKYKKTKTINIFVGYIKHKKTLNT